MSFFRPKQQAVISEASRAAWRTPEDVDSSVLALLSQANAMGEFVFSTDFSGYDATVKSEWQAVYWDMMKALFQFQWHGLIEEWADNFKHIPLVAGPGEIYYGPHGVGSGSVITNDMDSDDHEVAQEAAAVELDTVRHPLSQVQGDDGLLVLPGVRDAQAIEEVYGSFGFIANAEKQFVGVDDALYLQKYYHLSWPAGGMYPTYRALSALVYPERFHDSEKWDERMETLRALNILQNAKHHPCLLYTSPSPRDS